MLFDQIWILLHKKRKFKHNTKPISYLQRVWTIVTETIVFEYILSLGKTLDPKIGPVGIAHIIECI